MPPGTVPPPKFGRLELPVLDTKSGFFRKTCPYKIIVAYGQIEPYQALQRLGFIPYDDYIPACFIEYDEIDILKLRAYIGDKYLIETVRKLKNDRLGVILHGNCQMTVLANYLKANEEFNKKFILINTPRIFLYDKAKLMLLDMPALWENTDWLIFHQIKTDNRFGKKLSSDYFVDHLKESARKLCLCNMWFTGYVPQAIKNKNNVLTYFQMSGLFPMGDRNADDLALRGFSTDEIVKILSDPNYYTRQEMLSHIEIQFADICQREKYCDVKILDFIKENYNKRVLFHSPNHPTHFLMAEVARRVLRFMGINDVSFRHQWWIARLHSLRGQDMPIYPSVFKALSMDGLMKEDLIYFANAGIDSRPLDFEGWIRLYCSACLNCN